MYIQTLSCVQLIETLRTVVLQAPLTMRFSRQEYWMERVAISFSKGSSPTRDRTWVSYTADGFFTN